MNQILSKEIELRQNLAGENFTIAPPRGIKVSVLGELDCAKDFEDENLYIFTEIRLPEGWDWNQEDYYDPRATETDESDLMNRRRSTTQFSRAVPEGEYRHPVCHFSFPLAYSFYANEEAMHKAWPKICIQVNSLDDWGRHRIQGYGFLQIPNMAGYHKIGVQTWRPIESLGAEVHSFYLGGSVRVENPWELNDTFTYDEEGRKTVVNRYGLHTMTSGEVEFTLNVAVQSYREMEAQRLIVSNLNQKQKDAMAWEQHLLKERTVRQRMQQQYSGKQ